MKNARLLMVGLGLPMTMLVTGLCAGAQDAPGPGAPPARHPFSIDDVSEDVRSLVRRDPSRYLTATIQTLYTFNQTGTVTQVDVDRVERANAARARASSLVPFLSFDLNGDGRVTAAEADQTVGVRSASERAKLDVALLTGDTNGDKALSLDEMVAHLESSEDKRHSSSNRIQNPMLFDMNGDGSVNAVEVSEAVNIIAVSAIKVDDE